MADEQQCIFCHIASGKVPAKKVFEDDKVVAVLDINPAAQGHVLVLPKKHAAVMPQLEDDIVVHLGMIAKQLSMAVIRGMNAEGTTIFTANGVAAGQRAPHFLLHIIPRKKGDGLELDLPVSKIDQNVMSAVLGKLAPGVKKHFGVDLKIPKSENKSEENKEVKPEADKSEKKSGKPNLDDIAGLLLK